MGLDDLLKDSVKKQKEIIEENKSSGKEVKIFDYLNQIFYKTDKYEYNKKVAPAYMLSMWLSHDIRLLDVVGKINSLQFHLKDDIIYKYYFTGVPKGKRFIKWIKKTPAEKKFNKKVEGLMEEGFSKREAIIIQKHKERLGL